MSDYLGSLDPANLQNLVRNLESRIRALELREVMFNSLEEVTNDLGLQQAGEFRAGNGIEPGDGFTGGRFGYPGFEYDGMNWFLAGVNSDQLVVGLDLETGKLLAAGGALIIDETGLNLNGIRYALRHYAEDPDGANPRYGRFEMFYPDGKTLPALGILFMDGTEAAELITNGDFEDGDLTGWTGASWNILPIGYGGVYSCAGLNTLLSDRCSVTAGSQYRFRIADYKNTSGYGIHYYGLIIYARWYDDPSAGTLLQTDIVGNHTGVGGDGWVLMDKTIRAPSGAQSVEFYMDAGSISDQRGRVDNASIQLVSLSNKFFFDPDLIYQDGLGARKVLACRHELYTPRRASAALVATSTGNVTWGAHTYKVTFVDSEGETDGSAISNSVTNDTTHRQTTVTIPLGPQGTVSRKIYRTAAGGASWLLLATVENNTAASYTDNIADANLGATVPMVNTTRSWPLLPTKHLVRWQTDVRSILKTGDTWIASSDPAGPYNFITYGCGAASANDGDWFEFDVYLAPGTYTMRIHHYAGGTRGKLDFYENGSATPFASGVDLYSSTSVAVEKVVTGCVLTGVGLHHILALINGKNASSSDYVAYIADIEFIRDTA